jgi:hypothetical protein
MRPSFIYENIVYDIIYSEYTGNPTAVLFNTVYGTPCTTNHNNSFNIPGSGFHLHFPGCTFAPDQA